MKNGVYILDKNDIEAFKTILLSKPKYLEIYKQIGFSTFEEMYSRKNVTRWGYFLEGKLTASVSIEMNYNYNMVIHQLMVSNSNGPFNPNNSGISSCLEEAVKYSESNSIYTIYTVRTLTDLKLQEKRNSWKIDGKHNLWRERYTTFIEYYIEPYEKPPNIFYNAIAGDMISPACRVISSQHLKDKYRKENSQHGLSGDYTLHLKGAQDGRNREKV